MSTPVAEGVVSGEEVISGLVANLTGALEAQQYLDGCTDDELCEAYIGAVHEVQVAALTPDDKLRLAAARAAFTNYVLLKVQTRDRLEPTVPTRLETFFATLTDRYPEIKNDECYALLGLRLQGEVVIVS